VDFVAVTRSLASLSLLAAASGLLVLLAWAIPAGRTRLAEELGGRHRILLGVATLVALVSSLGSLYYSEVVGFVPCVLCWYQRIAMYPLVAVLAVGAISGDVRAWRYGLPLSVVGLLIAIYHVTIQFRPALDVGTCDASVPCTARYVNEFGFVSIPVMAGGGFLLISALLLAVHASGRRQPL
jgi:hypothetical protein